MNTLPIQMPSSLNAAPDAASKTRQVDEPDTGNSFQKTLKEEIADRRLSGAHSVAAPSDQGKTAATAQPQSKKTSETVTDGQEGEKTEPALDAGTDAMAQFLILANQFAQASSQPAGEVKSDAGLASTAVSASSAKSDSSAEFASLVQTGKDTGKDVKTALDQAALAQQPASAISEKAAPAALPAAEAAAFGRQLAEQRVETPLQPTTSVAFASLQQAGLDTIKEQAGAPADRIAPQVATPAWNNAVGQKVVWMATNEQQSASLTLNPPDLGPLKVVVSISDNMATASFVSAHPDVRQALEAALPRLREMLGEAGIQLGQTHVGAGTSGEYGSQAEQQQAAQRLSQSGDNSLSTLLDARTSPELIRRGLVDTFA